jgi:hypothetical protein
MATLLKLTFAMEFFISFIFSTGICFEASRVSNDPLLIITASVRKLIALTPPIKKYSIPPCPRAKAIPSEGFLYFFKTNLKAMYLPVSSNRAAAKHP